MALIPDIKSPQKSSSSAASNQSSQRSKSPLQPSPRSTSSATQASSQQVSRKNSSAQKSQDAQATRNEPKPKKPTKPINRKRRAIIIGGLITIVVALGIQAGLSGRTLYAESLAGKDAFLAAQTALTDQHFTDAADQLQLAEDHLTSAHKASSHLFWLKWLPWVSTQFKAVDNLLIGGIHIASALQDISYFADDIFSTISTDDATISNISAKDRKAILERLTNSPELISSVQADLLISVDALDAIPDKGVIAPIAVAVLPIQEKLPLIREMVEKAIPFLEVAPTIMGYPEEQTYLFLMQNNTELRPTGGFIGTYGILQLKNADIKQFETDNIYNLDVPVKDELHITPPEPMQRFLGSSQWFMRDSNWNPDFPTTAQKVEEFYHLEHGPIDQIDGVIAVTPDLIESLLEVTGPITVEGNEYNYENMTEKLQYEVEVGYRADGASDSERKEVIGTLASDLMSRLMSLPKNQWGDLFSQLVTNLEEKHIMIYSKNEQAQDLVSRLGWGGAIREHDGDYVMIVDANLAALKTDRVMDKQIEYSVTEENGDYIANLTLRYKNDGIFDFFTTRYRSYTRIYVPEGSELIETTGFLSNDRISGGSETPATVSLDEDLHKTVFEGFISVEPQTEDTMTLRYKLPQTVVEQIESGQYTLYVQKQPGTNNITFTGDIELDQSIKTSTGVDELEKDGNNKVHFSLPLETDQELTLELR